MGACAPIDQTLRFRLGTVTSRAVTEKICGASPRKFFWLVVFFQPWTVVEPCSAGEPCSAIEWGLGFDFGFDLGFNLGLDLGFDLRKGACV